MGKKHLLILFGGQSSEHEVSCRSAVTIINAVDPAVYEWMLIGITREGRWVRTDNVRQIETDSWRQGETEAILSPAAAHQGVWLMEADGPVFWPVEVVFSVLHGTCGEDGTIQGLLELAKIPYVGCGVLASAVSMDKVYTKQIVRRLGIRQAEFVIVYREEVLGMENSVKKLAQAVDRVEQKLAYPVFIKPSSSGSSCGVSKAENREQLKTGLREAARHGRKILVEETIVGREVECAVLGGLKPQASGVGEILSAASFYDYDAKYNSPESQTVTDPDLPGDATQQIRQAAVEIFRAVDGWGLSRVDFFVEEKSGEVVFNEINTMPGFTSISMYPLLWETRGLPVKQLVARLLENAMEREGDGYDGNW